MQCAYVFRLQLLHVGNLKILIEKFSLILVKEIHGFESLKIKISEKSIFVVIGLIK